MKKLVFFNVSLLSKNKASFTSLFVINYYYKCVCVTNILVDIIDISTIYEEMLHIVSDLIFC